MKMVQQIYHSTKTALIKVINGILMNQNEQCTTALVAIDLSAAFDLVKLNNDKTEWLICYGNPDFSKSVTLTVGAETIE